MITAPPHRWLAGHPSLAVAHGQLRAARCALCWRVRLPDASQLNSCACGAGDLIKSLRTEAMDKPGTMSSTSVFMADRFETVAAVVPPFLNLVSFAHRVVGAAPLAGVSGLLNRASGNLVPVWNPHMPRGAAPLQMPLAPAPAPTPAAREIPRKVVYMPSCVTRMMGPSLQDSETDPVHAKILSILSKVRHP